jgi:hypothetical protein
MSDSFVEKLRLIRFRRKRERTKFRDELKIIPRWLFGTCVVLYFLALFIGIAINLHNIRSGDPVFPDDSLRSNPGLSCLALAGAITGVAIFLSLFLFMLGYVYRDARRRGMHAGLWTLLVLILSPGYVVIGLVIYLLVREPLPYPCPNCSTEVSARFNFCPRCKYNLHPACPQCQREVSDTDKFCANCGTELIHALPKSADTSAATALPSRPEP